MKFLIDAPLSPDLADGLRRAGHDAVHVRDYHLAAAEDGVVFARCALEDRVLVSADTDFSTMLALRGEARPSVVLFRRGTERRPEAQLRLMLEHVGPLQKDLVRGCVVVIEETRIRVRSLPIGTEPPG